MKIFASQHEFEYSWNEVSIANWQKYSPWNDKSTHVIAVDTLNRHVDPTTGILRTERLITCKQSAPAWLNSFLGGKEVSHVYETSYVDPTAKKVTMCSMNMTWSDLLSVRETVVYRPCPNNPNGKTVFDQHAKIIALCGGWQKIKNSIEEFTVDRFRQNAIKGREGFEAVLEMSRKVFAMERERQKMEGMVAA
ncbi:Protein UPS2, mitochondrial [Sphaceloma murrayae]|uniref:Protein UPS2, mitochondrial n=1 Tax=Sphaceloma murrayae TaxID=2082308 RepID=A0A2K1QIZ5_9PEZI|nr:Protein UPS2, mitochondrial [Sphaceloma murrayae]